MAETIDIQVPIELMRKLNEFAKKQLSSDETLILNTVFGVYNFAIDHRCDVFEQDPALLRELEKFEEEQLERAFAFTPTITTITLTTTLASHPIITCSARREC